MKFSDIDFIKYITAFLGCIFSYLFGCADQILITLVILTAFDFLTGLMNGVKTNTVNSKRASQGIAKKVGFYVIVCVAVLIDRAVGANGSIRALVIWFYISTESISIIENISKLGVPMPKKLIKILEQLKDKSK